MSEDETKLVASTPEFQRVQSTLDRLAAHLERVEAYIKTVDEKIDRQSYNTQPMWEKALAEFADVKHNLATLSRKIDVFSGDMLNLRAEQLQNEDRLRRLEADNEGGGMTRIN